MKVGISCDFFEKGLRDYADYRTAWVRELLQNGSDCGAATTKFEFQLTANPTVELHKSAELACQAEVAYPTSQVATKFDQTAWSSCRPGWEHLGSVGSGAKLAGGCPRRQSAPPKRQLETRSRLADR